MIKWENRVLLRWLLPSIITISFNIFPKNRLLYMALAYDVNNNEWQIWCAGYVLQFTNKIGLFKGHGQCCREQFFPTQFWSSGKAANFHSHDKTRITDCELQECKAVQLLIASETSHCWPLEFKQLLESQLAYHDYLYTNHSNTMFPNLSQSLPPTHTCDSKTSGG